jgi:hypothetical protein
MRSTIQKQKFGKNQMKAFYIYKKKLATGPRPKPNIAVFLTLLIFGCPYA